MRKIKELNHFSKISKSIQEVSRVLKENGQFFISDPRPNDCDITRFVDDYMQLKYVSQRKRAQQKDMSKSLQGMISQLLIVIGLHRQKMRFG